MQDKRQVATTAEEGLSQVKQDTGSATIQGMEFNPIEKAVRNDACPACKANKFMIHRIQESLKDIRSEMRMEYSYQKRNMEMQKEEIMALKTKCKHLEEAVTYDKNNTMSNEGENSINYDKKKQPSQEQ